MPKLDKIASRKAKYWQYQSGARRRNLPHSSYSSKNPIVVKAENIMVCVRELGGKKSLFITLSEGVFAIILGGVELRLLTLAAQ